MLCEREGDTQCGLYVFCILEYFIRRRPHTRIIRICVTFGYNTYPQDMHISIYAQS